MKYYNFLAKSPGTVIVAGKRYRLMAGETLRLPEDQGNAITSNTAPGYEYLLLISVEDTTPVSESVLVETEPDPVLVESEPEPELEPEVVQPKPKSRSKAK
jgi:hypothetical protein